MRHTAPQLHLETLAPAGAAGIVHVLEILEDEIRICLDLLGVTTFGAIDKSYNRQVVYMSGEAGRDAERA